jgi:hypothetical protein
MQYMWNGVMMIAPDSLDRRNQSRRMEEAGVGRDKIDCVKEVF